MTRHNAHPFLSGAVERRTFLKAAGGAAALGVAGTLFPQAAFAKTGLVALVHTQAAGDNGPVDSMISKLKQLAREKGFKYRTIYAKDPATYQTIFQTLGNAGASIVVSTFNEVAQPIKAVAPKFPKTKWIQLFGDPMNPPIPNVVTVSYDYYLGCYLSGMFAASVSKSGKIGYIGGISIPPLNADFNALKVGAAAVNAKVTAKAAFAGSFQDPAKGQEIAAQMYQDGIDYIQTDSAATDTGIIQAANDGKGLMVSAISPQQYKLGPSTVISIVALDFGQSLYNEVSKAIGGNWNGGQHVSTGLGTGVIDFVLSPVFQKKGPADLVAAGKKAWPAIEKAKADIISGKLKVPFDTKL